VSGLLLLGVLWLGPQHAAPPPHRAAHHLLQHAATRRAGKQPAARRAAQRRPPRRRAVRRRPLGIAPARAAQIQQALVAAGYLHHASGRWDAATAAAMKKFQAEHRWQTRFVPDARALIALGLGPAATPLGG